MMYFFIKFIWGSDSRHWGERSFFFEIDVFHALLLGGVLCRPGLQLPALRSTRGFRRGRIFFGLCYGARPALRFSADLEGTPIRLKISPKLFFGCFGPCLRVPFVAR